MTSGTTRVCSSVCRPPLDADKTDVVHDLLAHLAQCMIDLNKQKQGEVKRFLDWLEKRLKIQPKNDGSTGIDSLTGKTILQGYLGDYQKGEDETPLARIPLPPVPEPQPLRCLAERCGGRNPARV